MELLQSVRSSVQRALSTVMKRCWDGDTRETRFVLVHVVSCENPEAFKIEVMTNNIHLGTVPRCPAHVAVTSSLPAGIILTYISI